MSQMHFCLARSIPTLFPIQIPSFLPLSSPPFLFLNWIFFPHTSCKQMQISGLEFLVNTPYSLYSELGWISPRSTETGYFRHHSSSKLKDWPLTEKAVGVGGGGGGEYLCWFWQWEIMHLCRVEFPLVFWWWSQKMSRAEGKGHRLLH